MEMIKCAICNDEMSKENGYRDPWENLDYDELLCESCFYSQEEQVYDYLFDMDYSCVNGCCSCCGCSCNYDYYDDDYEDEIVEDRIVDE